MKTINKCLIQAGFDGDVPLIMHQCNCQRVMGAGLAKRIKSRCPNAYGAYMSDKNMRLGGYSVAVDNGCHVVNLYGQYRYGRRERHTNYAALSMAMMRVVIDSGFKTFGIPKNIGCVNGGGSWFVVEDILIDIEKMFGVEFLVCDYG